MQVFHRPLRSKAGTITQGSYLRSDLVEYGSKTQPEAELPLKPPSDINA